MGHKSTICWHESNRLHLLMLEKRNHVYAAWYFVCPHSNMITSPHTQSVLHLSPDLRCESDITPWDHFIVLQFYLFVQCVPVSRFDVHTRFKDIVVALPHFLRLFSLLLKQSLSLVPPPPAWFPSSPKEDQDPSFPPQNNGLFLRSCGLANKAKSILFKNGPVIVVSVQLPDWLEERPDYWHIAFELLADPLWEQQIQRFDVAAMSAISVSLKGLGAADTRSWHSTGQGGVYMHDGTNTADTQQEQVVTMVLPHVGIWKQPKWLNYWSLL